MVSERHLTVRRVCSILCVSLFTLLACRPDNDDTIHQISTLSALMEGQFDGVTMYSTLHSYGDFGLGTFDALDGEMIALDGVFYRVDTAGTAHVVADTLTTPFADVTFFAADMTDTIATTLDFDGLADYLAGILPDTTKYYAIRVDGSFTHVRTRSVAAQPKPYPNLAEAFARQVEFDFTGITGTMVGFYMPTAAQGTSTTGFHFHFISEDRMTGGHLLGCIVERARIGIDDCAGLSVIR